jgi:hypothetical protein
MTDAAFRAWIQTLPSCISGKSSGWLPDVGEWRNSACHVRRAGRSGVAFKEKFACIPLTNEEHQYQHQHGELACLLRYFPQGKMIAWRPGNPGGAGSAMNRSRNSFLQQLISIRPCQADQQITRDPAGHPVNRHLSRTERSFQSNQHEGRQTCQPQNRIQRRERGRGMNLSDAVHHESRQPSMPLQRRLRYGDGWL